MVVQFFLAGVGVGRLKKGIVVYVKMVIGELQYARWQKLIIIYGLFGAN